jgi:hypothetical protein
MIMMMMMMMTIIIIIIEYLFRVLANSIGLLQASTKMHEKIQGNPKKEWNKKFWEEVVSCFSFTTTWVFNMTSRKIELEYVYLMKWIIEYSLRGFSVGITDGIYEVSSRGALRWHDIHVKFHEDWRGHSRNIKIITSKIWETAVLVILMGGIYAVQMASCGMIYTPRFIKFSFGLNSWGTYIHTDTDS